MYSKFLMEMNFVLKGFLTETLEFPAAGFSCERRTEKNNVASTYISLNSKCRLPVQGINFQE